MTLVLKRQRPFRRQAGNPSQRRSGGPTELQLELRSARADCCQRWLETARAGYVSSECTVPATGPSAVTPA